MSKSMTERLIDGVEAVEDRIEGAVEGAVDRLSGKTADQKAAAEEKKAAAEGKPAADDADAGDDGDAGSSGGATEAGDDSGGGYVASGGGASYASDIAMMRQEVSYTETQVIPHYELLISQAERVGNGPKTIQALRAGLEAARRSLGAAQDAITQVQNTSEPVQAAYDDTAGEAAKDKAYFHGD